MKTLTFTVVSQEMTVINACSSVAQDDGSACHLGAQSSWLGQVQPLVPASLSNSCFHMTGAKACTMTLMLFGKRHDFPCHLLGALANAALAGLNTTDLEAM